MTLRFTFLTIVTAAMASLPAVAATSCGFGSIKAANARVGVVQPPTLHFVEDDSLVKGCPNASAKCQEKSYVVAGDMVLMGDIQGDYVCTGFVTKAGHSLNEWLPISALKPAQPDQQSPSDWAGKWTSFDNDIHIAQKGNSFIIRGEAEWKGDVSVHTGDLNGEAAATNGVIAFTMGDDTTLPFKAGGEFDCRVSMVRRGPYLLVEDNRQCGGANVTFTGFYRRGASNLEAGRIPRR